MAKRSHSGHAFIPKSVFLEHISLQSLNGSVAKEASQSQGTESISFAGPTFWPEKECWPVFGEALDRCSESRGLNSP